jgi:hypothetical protein
LEVEKLTTFEQAKHHLLYCFSPLGFFEGLEEEFKLNGSNQKLYILPMIDV